MKIGCETIIFGAQLDDLDHTLATLAHLGFSGVEFSQRPRRIYLYDSATGSHHPVSIEELASRLKANGLTFLGMAGGTVAERIDFCRNTDPERLERLGVTEADCRPHYLYVEDPAGEDATYAMERGFDVACHPHAFSRFDRVEAAKPYFDDQNPRLHWMPDAAHMFVTGEDPVAVVRSLPIEKMIAVHLKDFDAAYGRSYHRYAKGFGPLGTGDVPLEDLLDVLRDRDYDGWLVVEQDYALDDPVNSLLRSVRWLSARGLAQHSIDLLPEGGPHLIPRPSEFENLGMSLAQFSARLFSASDSPLDVCYQRIAEAVCRLFRATHVSLWSCSQARDDLFLLTSYPPHLHTHEEPFSLDRAESALGSVVNPMEVREFTVANLVQPDGQRRFAWQSVARQTGAETAIAMAIPNRYNPHVVRMIIGIMRGPEPAVDARGITGAIAGDIARAADIALDDACSAIANRVNMAADRTNSLQQFLEELEKLIRSSLKCEALTIFLASRSGERLEARWSTNGKCAWDPTLRKEERCYRAHEIQHPTVQSWTQYRTILMAVGNTAFREGEGGAKSHEDVPDSSKERDNILLVPLVAVSATPDGRQHTSVLGVVRCRNKRPIMLPDGQEGRPYFTDDDAAILSAICQAAAPHVDVLRRDEWLLRSLAHLTHELNMPVNTLQAATDELRTLLKKDADPLVGDLLENMLSWTGLMSRVIGAADIFGRKGERLQMQCKPTHFMGDVIAPLKPQLRFLLANRGFDVSRVTYSDFWEVPRLWIDRNLFQMVFFNLLSNAIKYAYNDRSRFKIHIDCGQSKGFYWISCSDWGPGIDERHVSTIFEEGVRGPESVNRIVEGMGFGLWIVRRIVEAHGGSVEVSNVYNPTTFTMYLPESLRSSAPKQQQ